jgi:hypothetical protein
MTALAESPCDPLPSAVVRGSLAHGLLACLGLLDHDRDCFESAAVAWHARWCEAVPGAQIAESRAVLSALEALRGDDPPAGARALRDQCLQHQLQGLAAVLDHWLEHRSPVPGATRRSPAGAGASASGSAAAPRPHRRETRKPSRTPA